MTASLKFNVIVNAIRSVLAILFPLITFKYASVVLGPQGIGITNYSQTIVSYFQLFATFGITTYAISEGSKFRNDKVQFNEFVGEVFTINLLTSLVSLLVLFCLSCLGCWGHYNSYILIFGVTILFNLIGVEWLFSIYEQFLYITLRSFLIQVISLVLLFVLVKDSKDLTIYVWLTVFATAGSSIFNYYKSKQLCRISLSSFKRCKKHILPMFIIFATGIASLIYVNSNIVILGLMKDDITVGIYSAAIKVIKPICTPIASIGFVVVPRIAEKLAHSTSNTDIETLCKKVLDFMLFFILPFSIGLYLMADEAILLLSGPDFLTGSLVIKILILDIFFSPINGFLVTQLLVPFGKQNLGFIATILGAIVNIVLNLALIPCFSLYGAAVATIMSELVVFSVCIPFIIKKFRISYLASNLYQYVLASLPIFPIYWLTSCLCTNYIYEVLFTVVISAIAYVIILRQMRNYVVTMLLDFIPFCKRKSI